MDQLNQQPPVSLGGQSTEQEKTALPVVSILTALLHEDTTKPSTTNVGLRDRSNKCNDKRTYRKKKFSRDKDGVFNENDYYVKERVPDFNIWDFYVGGGNSTNDKVAFEHPAIFPEELVKRHIESWSDEKDLIYDPFMGSGTTSKMCLLTNRNFIGSEINEEYCEIEKRRLSTLQLSITHI